MQKIYITTVLFISLLIISCKSKNKDESIESKGEEFYLTLTDAQIKAGNIVLDSIQTQTFDGIIEVTGKIEVPPASNAVVSSLMSGRINGLNLIEGQYVSKGQYLFTVESPEFISLQQEYAALGAQLEYLKNDYERQLKLFNENVNSEKKYLQAESAYKSSLANFKGLEKKLKLLGVNTDEVAKGNFFNGISLRAPLSGSIAQIHSVNGSFVSTTQPVLELVNTQNAHLTMEVFENTLPLLKIGQKIRFTDAQNNAYHARIHLISPIMDMDTKTVRVHADIVENVKFYDGMFVSAQITTDSQSFKAIPASAVLTEGTQNYILVWDKKEKETSYFSKYPIQITQKNEKYVSFREADLLKGKKIVIDGAFMLQKEE